MEKSRKLASIKMSFLGLVALFILGLPGVSHAYTYQNKEFSFKIECPAEPIEVMRITDAEDKGVALNFSANEAENHVWLIQIRKGDFVNPRQMSEPEVQKLLADLKKEDYGEGKICDSVELIDVGKYQGVMLLVHDAEDRMAISMVQTDRGTYLLTLVGDLTNNVAFARKMDLYKKSVATFANL